MDLTEYCKRINFKGWLQATRETLFALQECHLLSVPFENLDIHSKTSIQLDVNKIHHKVIVNRRGGFCYELNGLFYEFLKKVGFDVKIISTRVYDKDKGLGPEFDHLAILCSIDENRYLVDVGFGEFTNYPLKLEKDIEQKDKRGTFKILELENKKYKVMKLELNEWKPQYRFNLEERKLKDFVGRCNYHETSSESHFSKNKLCTIQTDGGRITLTDESLKIVDVNGERKLNIGGALDFSNKLMEYFGIEIN